MINWESTRGALKKLDGLLKCLKCGQTLEDPCTLEGCDHNFCRHCIAGHIGSDSKCPECGAFAWIKDLKTNRQLCITVSLCNKLGSLVNPESNKEKSIKDTPQPILGEDDRLENGEEDNLADMGGDETDSDPDVDFDEDDHTYMFQTPDYANHASDMKDTEDCEEDKGRGIEKDIEKDDPIDNASDSGIIATAEEELSNEIEDAFTFHSDSSPNSLHEPSSQRQETFINETVLRRRENAKSDCVFGSQSGNSKTPSKRVKTPCKVYGNKKAKNKKVRKLCSLGKTSSDETSEENCLEHESDISNVKKRELAISGQANDGKQVIDVEDDGEIASDVNQCNEKDTIMDDVKDSGNDDLVSDVGMETPSPARKAQKSRKQPRDKSTENISGQPDGKLPRTLYSFFTPLRKVSPRNKSGKRDQSKSTQATPSKPAWMKKNQRGETLLHIASIKGDLATVEDLLSKGADPNVKDNAGWTPLHEACNHGHLATVQALLHNGALIDTPGFEHETPLHDAVINNRVEVVKLLVAGGASVTTRNQRGLTAKDYAASDIMLQALTPHSSNIIQASPASSGKQQVNTTVSSSANVPKVLLATGLNADEKEQLKKCAKQLGAAIVNEYNHTVTHVVSSVNKEGYCPRTMKYLLGILTGKWIVKFTWITGSLHSKRWIPEDEFEVEGTVQTHVCAPRRSRENTFGQLPGLFDGCHFFLFGNFTPPTPSREDLNELIRQGGGSILSREPKPGNEAVQFSRPYHAKAVSSLGKCSKFIVYDPSSDRKPKTVRTELVCTVPAGWIMSCISHFELLDVPEEE